MNRYQTLTQLRYKRITEEEAAEKLGLTLKDLRFRMTRYGNKLPITLKTLDRIEEDEITRGEAASLLDVSLRQVNNLMKAWGASRPLKEYLVERAVSTVKWEIRKKYAIEYIAGSSDFETSAEKADVSVRQMRRWVADLLDVHYGMVTKDLKELPAHKRQKLADEIEDKEGLEIAKLSVLNEVARGQREIEDVALERVLYKRAHKGKHVRGRSSNRQTRQERKPGP